MWKLWLPLVIVLISVGCSSNKGALSSTDSDLRRQALIELAHSGNFKAYLPEFINVLKNDSNALVRSQAAIYLGKFKATESVPALLNALKDQNEWVRYESALALGNIGDASAINGLAQVVENDPVALVRRGATQALGNINDSKIIPILINRLEDAEPSVNQAAWLVLQKITGQSLPNNVEIWQKWFQGK
ncbi:MAG: HEAT repeat domain-containing protein [Planctomycetota bacterium]